MTFADELLRCLKLGMTAQYIDNRGEGRTKLAVEPPVYFKRTHGQRSELNQDLWGGQRNEHLNLYE